jgi:hypothetical protein
VRVTFYVNTPPGVGDDGTWTPFDTVDIGTLAAGEERVVEAARKWHPSVGEHTCAKVLVEPMSGEVTFGNNQAQENFAEFETGAASPYAPIEFDVVTRNPYTVPIVMDMRSRNIPEDWFVAVDHASVYLAPGQQKMVHVTTWTDRTPEWDPRQKDRNGPRKALVHIEGWGDRWGDQLFPIGGVTALVRAVRSVELRIQARSKQLERGSRLELSGETVPQAGPGPVAIHVRDPAGKLHVERNTLDATGRFVHKSNVPLQTGPYVVRAYTLLGGMAAEVESRPIHISVQ